MHPKVSLEELVDLDQTEDKSVIQKWLCDNMDAVLHDLHLCYNLDIGNAILHGLFTDCRGRIRTDEEKVRLATQFLEDANAPEPIAFKKGELNEDKIRSALQNLLNANGWHFVPGTLYERRRQAIEELAQRLTPGIDYLELT